MEISDSFMTGLQVDAGGRVCGQESDRRGCARVAEGGRKRSGSERMDGQVVSRVYETADNNL